MKVPSLPVMDVDAGYASIWPQLTEASREALAREALHPDATCYASPGTSAELLRLTGEGLDPRDLRRLDGEPSRGVEARDQRAIPRLDSEDVVSKRLNTRADPRVRIEASPQPCPVENCGRRLEGESEQERGTQHRNRGQAEYGHTHDGDDD